MAVENPNVCIRFEHPRAESLTFFSTAVKVCPLSARSFGNLFSLASMPGMNFKWSMNTEYSIVEWLCQQKSRAAAEIVSEPMQEFWVREQGWQKSNPRCGHSSGATAPTTEGGWYEIM